MRCPHSMPPVIDALSHTLSTRASRLSLRLSLSAPPAAPPLSPIPAPLLSSITHRPVCLPSVPTSYRPCRLLGTSVAPLPRCRHRPLRSRSPIAHARVYRLRSPHRSTQPYHITPSVPPRRPDIAAARPSRRMAPRGTGEEESDMPVQHESARLSIAPARYARRNT